MLEDFFNLPPVSLSLFVLYFACLFVSPFCLSFYTLFSVCYASLSYVLAPPCLSLCTPWVPVFLLPLSCVFCIPCLSFYVPDLSLHPPFSCIFPPPLDCLLLPLRYSALQFYDQILFFTVLWHVTLICHTMILYYALPFQYLQYCTLP